MASGPEGTALLNCQTTVLKVSIHCEGCKKKVRKVLQGLDGVYTIDINSKQNKVTVTGSVDAESLIRRLYKYGKHAELWQEKKPTATNSSDEAGVDSKAKVASAVVAATKTEQQLLNTEKQQQTEEGKNKTTPAPPTETTATAPVTAAASSAISDEASASKSSDAPKCNDSDKPANSDKKDSDKAATSVDADASEEADDLKKKGKKAQGDTSSISERAISESDTVANADGATEGVSPPPPKQFPVYAQPIYTVSYSAVQPSTSYSYYTPSPAAMPSSYTYSGYPSPSPHPPENYSLDPYYGSMEAPAASGESYDMFNDENPNACNLM